MIEICGKGTAFFRMLYHLPHGKFRASAFSEEVHNQHTNYFDLKKGGGKVRYDASLRALKKLRREDSRRSFIYKGVSGGIIQPPLP